LRRRNIYLHAPFNGSWAIIGKPKDEKRHVLKFFSASDRKAEAPVSSIELDWEYLLYFILVRQISWKTKEKTR